MLFEKLPEWYWKYVYLSGDSAKFMLKKQVVIKPAQSFPKDPIAVNSKTCPEPNGFSLLKLIILSALLTFNFQLLTFNCTAQDITIKINLRGVAESKISLLPLKTFPNPIAIGFQTLEKSISNSETATLSVPKAHLPAEFVLRFDYKEKAGSSPYPCEKHIFISNQNLELWVNPMFCNNKDSAWFQKDEKENALFAKFTEENGKQKEKIGLLQNFLMNYDDTQSAFYQQGIEEYEKRRSQYNQWITKQSTQHQALFVSHTFQFQYVPQIVFEGSDADTSPPSPLQLERGGRQDGVRLQSLLAHYFDGIDFNDPLLINTIELKKWMTDYVNIYGSMVKTEAQRDSLFTLAGKTAIEKARQGNPKVYGWMVDYFYNGFESFNMTAGIKMLEPYINDTNCLTTKRQAIEKRLEGMKTLLTGTLAPDFTFKDETDNAVQFHQYKTNCRYKLLLFWSADCGHCKELVSKLYPWHQQLSDKKSVEVFALSLDDTKTEIPVWQQAISQLPDWKHIRCEGGINSPEANAYFILSTPVMILVDAKTNKICAMPENIEQLINEVAAKK